jgi:hypothetical protein
LSRGVVGLELTREPGRDELREVGREDEREVLLRAEWGPLPLAEYETDATGVRASVLDATRDADCFELGVRAAGLRLCMYRDATGFDRFWLPPLLLVELLLLEALLLKLRWIIPF